MKKSLVLLSFVFVAFASCSSDDDTKKETPVAEAVIQATLGGPNQQNQVFVDLSTTEQTTAIRDSWDLGFSTGTEFRVIINGSTKMAVKKLETTNIDEVQEADASVAVGFSTLSTLGYVDNPTGILSGAGNGEGTAIAEISSNDADNKVYLVNLGYAVGTTTPNVGTVAMDGDARGWKKIRIIRNGTKYELQYADLNATTHQTVTVSKDDDFNFVFVSLNNGQKVTVQPKKEKWDLCFTGFTNYFPYMGSNITYFYSDFVASNMRGGTKIYQIVSTSAERDQAFTNFTLANVQEAEFTTSATDQRIIGANWRNGGGPTSSPSVKDDRFYIVKDVAGNIFKLKFLALTNDAGVRGYPAFEYKRLN